MVKFRFLISGAQVGLLLAGEQSDHLCVPHRRHEDQRRAVAPGLEKCGTSVARQTGSNLSR
jgi:hypothetical protein